VRACVRVQVVVDLDETLIHTALDETQVFILYYITLYYMKFKASESVQRSAISVGHHMPAKNVVQLGYTPLARVLPIWKFQLLLHVLANPLSELGRQILEHRVVLAICILEPDSVRRSCAFWPV
jgi:hypothetical protein